MQKIGIVIAMALALFAVPALAQSEGTLFGNGGVDILAQGIFEAEGSAIQIPNGVNANLDGVIVGNDKALSFGTTWGMTNPIATAENNLEIKKNQQSGNSLYDITTGILFNSTLVNAEQIKVGNREALAFGSATSKNNVKIVTNQMGGTISTVGP